MRPSNVEHLEPRSLFSGVPTLAVADLSVVEGNAGTSNAAAVVTLSALSKKTVTVNFATANGSAAAGLDYAAAAGKLSFAPGQTRKTILVPIKADRLAEADESFLVRLSGAANARIGRAQAAVTIADDEPRVSLAAGSVGVYEGNSGTTPLAFEVTLSRPYDQPVTVDFATSDSTAIAGEDYVAAAGTLTFAPGETVKTITLQLIGDAAPEFDEGFFLNFSGVSTNASLGDGLSGYAAIADDDAFADYDSGSDPWSYWPGYYWY